MPRMAERLIRWSIGDEVRARWVIGDLREEYAARLSASGGRRADLWCIATVTRLAARLFWTRITTRDTSKGTAPVALILDARYGLRTLRNAAGMSLVAVTTFAVGVGATTAIFAAVQALLLRPLPYDEPENLYRIQVNTGGEGWYGSSVPEFIDFEQELRSFESIAAWTAGDVTLGDTLSPHRERAAFATAALLPMLGVEPAMGRFFTQAEETPDNSRYVLLSWDLWQRDYGGRREVVGEAIPLLGSRYVVLGVMPRGFAFPDATVRAWFPYGLNRADPDHRNNHYLNLVGRLRTGASPEAAAAELSAYTQRARADYPAIYSERGFRGRILSLHEAVVGDMRPPLLVLMGAVVLVLLIACVNVANLLLSQGESRRRELAVRAALGASRGRLIRQLMTESLLLAAAGGALGLAVATVVLRVLVRLAPPDVPRIESVSLGLWPLLFSVALIGGAGILFGTVPALRATRGLGSEGFIRGRGVLAGRSVRRIRRSLVVSQIALAGILSVATGLMIRTLANLHAVDPGFDTGGVLSLAVSPQFNRYQEPDQRVAFWTEALDRLGGLPGVEAVGATSVMPLSNLYNNLSIRVEGRITTSIGDAPDARVQYVTPGLADALGLHLLEGRFLDRTDGPASRPVVVVSESFARTFWPAESAIGKTMKVFSDSYPWMTVVGVVADLKHDGLDQPPAPMWYVPTTQSATTAYGTPLQMFVILRTSGPPLALVPAVREALSRIDPTAPLSRIRPVQDLVETSIAGRVFTATLLRAFGLVALFLACIGVYGVTALAVTERRGEIGLRKALGAGSARILRLIAKEQLAVVGIGTAFGLGGGIVAARLMRSLLFGTGSADPLTMAGTLLLLIAAAAAATAIPSWRAIRTRALVSLRDEV